MTELLPTLREYADRGDRKMNVATLPLDIYELAIAALARALTVVSEQAEDEGLLVPAEIHHRRYFAESVAPTARSR